MRLLALRVGRVRQHGDPASADPLGKPWRSAIAKEAVAHPLWLSLTGLAGDEVGNTKLHGGPEQAVLAYASEHYAAWAAEGFRGEPGGFGENLLLEGLTDQQACIGDRFELGDAELQVSCPRVPCNTLARYHGRLDVMARVFEAGRGGWYFRVLREGHIAPGQALRLLARPHPGWTVARALEARRRATELPAEALELASLEGLDPAWRARLRGQAGGG